MLVFNILFCVSIHGSLSKFSCTRDQLAFSLVCTGSLPLYKIKYPNELGIQISFLTTLVETDKHTCLMLLYIPKRTATNTQTEYQYMWKTLCYQNKLQVHSKAKIYPHDFIEHYSYSPTAKMQKILFEDYCVHSHHKIATVLFRVRIGLMANTITWGRP